MPVSMDAIANLSKRRGFIFQSSEIYGGTGSVWDYGPLGVELKNNIKRLWWRDMVHLRDDMVGLDCGILMHPTTWEASGHIANFNDPMVDCRKCKARFRFDDLIPDDKVQGKLESVTINALEHALYDPHSKTLIALFDMKIGEGAEIRFRSLTLGGSIKAERKPEGVPFATREAFFIGLNPRSPANASYYAFFPVPPEVRPEKIDRPVLVFDSLEIPIKIKKYQCPACGGQLTEPRQFNLMFKTFMGPVEDSASVTYLRPETAQGIFVNFLNVLNASRKKLPFGIAQIGKAFRNEITPGNFIFRTREFEQMEIEYFCRPGTDEKLHQEWIDTRIAWHIKNGIKPEHLKLYEHPKEKLSHYSKRTVDILYKFPIGWSELEGIANRTDFDLKQHEQYSKQSLRYFDEETKQHITPYVIEPSVGVDRTFLAIMCDAYTEEQVRNEKRTVMKFTPELAPIKIAVLPLLKKNDKIVETANKLARELRQNWVTVYDDTAAIGRLYRRQDEVGTPFCVTVDVDTVDNDKKVTIRDRDSMKQIRVPMDNLTNAFQQLFAKGWNDAAPGLGPWHEPKASPE